MSRMSRGRSIMRPSMGANIPPRGAPGELLDRRQAAAEDRARELARDGVHVDLVPAPAMVQERLAAPADELEAGLLVGADRARVPRIDLEQHVAQAEDVEPPVER